MHLPRTLDGAELTTVYDKFIKMGGRRVTKGVEEASYRRAIGHKTVKNLTAGMGPGSAAESRFRRSVWRLARTPFAREGTSTMPPHALSRMRSPAAGERPEEGDRPAPRGLQAKHENRSLIYRFTTN